MAVTKVLIVDDSLSVRRALERVLRSKNFEVVAAQSGEEALEHFAATAPDLTIVDVIMPGIGGFELCRRLRAHSPQTPVILISGVGDAQIERQAFAVGAAAVIPKPFSPEDLSAALATALRPPELSADAATPAEVAEAAEPLPQIAALPASAPAEPQPHPQAEPDPQAEPHAEPESPPGLPEMLAKFLEKPEVLAATLSDRQGEGIAHVGVHGADAPTVASYSRFLLIAADVLGEHFEAEHTDGVVLEFPRHALYLGRVDEQHILSLYLSNTKALSVVRYLIRQTLPGLAAALQAESEQESQS